VSALAQRDSDTCTLRYHRAALFGTTTFISFSRQQMVAHYDMKINNVYRLEQCLYEQSKLHVVNMV